MKRIMTKCDKCGSLIEGPEISLHCLDTADGQDVSADLCRECFKALLVDYMGMTIQENNQEEMIP